MASWHHCRSNTQVQLLMKHPITVNDHTYRLWFSPQTPIMARLHCRGPSRSTLYIHACISVNGSKGAPKRLASLCCKNACRASCAFLPAALQAHLARTAILLSCPPGRCTQRSGLVGTAWMWRTPLSAAVHAPYQCKLLCVVFGIPRLAEAGVLMQRYGALLDLLDVAPKQSATHHPTPQSCAPHNLTASRCQTSLSRQRAAQPPCAQCHLASSFCWTLHSNSAPRVI